MPVSLVLVSSDHPGWDHVRTTLRERADVRVLDEVRHGAQVIPVVTRRRPDVVLLDVAVGGRALGTLIRDLRVAHPAGRLIVIGRAEHLGRETLLALWHLGVVGYFAWERLQIEALLRGVAAVRADDVLVGNRAVLQALLAPVERRRGPRLAELVLQPHERGALTDEDAAPRPAVLRATLWEQNPDVTALLETACALAGVELEVVSTAEALLATAARARADDFLLIDCSWALPDDLTRCALILSQTAVPVQIVHPHLDAQTALLPELPSGRVRWLRPAAVGLTVLDELRLRRAAAAAAADARRDPHLTDRQREVYRLIAAGYHDAEIAAQVGMRPGTVKTYVARLKAKFDLRTRAELIAAYPRLGGGGHRADTPVGGRSDRPVLPHPP